MRGQVPHNMTACIRFGTSGPQIAHARARPDIQRSQADSNIASCVAGIEQRKIDVAIGRTGRPYTTAVSNEMRAVVRRSLVDRDHLRVGEKRAGRGIQIAQITTHDQR